MRRSLPVAALLVAAGALPPAAQAAHAHPVVRSVSAPRSAVAGGPVDIEIHVARARAKVSFYLSTDRRRGGSDVRLAGDARGRGRIAAQPRVPAGQALGAYHVLACIGTACRAAHSTLQITATPVGTGELVAAAVAAHRLTPQQGLVYRVFAALGDPRLPAAYRGDDAQPEDLVMRDVVSQWSTLSRAQKATLLPYFTPPAAKGDPWRARGRAAAASIRPLPLVEPACDTDQAKSKDWLTIAKPGGHVRIWWLKSMDHQVGPQARSLLAEVESTMWPRLVAIFGREPLRDGSEHCFHGIDDKLDIYLWGLPKGRAMTFAYPPDCAASPAYIVFDARTTAPTRWEVAHELMHAFQFSYDYEGPCASYDKWDEATATWAAAWLYPRDDDEHDFRWFLRDPETPLDDASYEGWVFPYAMAQLHGAGTIASIYDQTERQPDVLRAIDAAVPGGLKQAWPEFARAAWNQAPAEPTFEQWDNFAQHPEENGHEIDARQLDAGPTGTGEVDVSFALDPLTRAYRHITFGPHVSEITVDKPSYPDLSVQAILRLRDGTEVTQDWSGKQPVFCSKDPAKRPAELLLVLANTSLSQPTPSGLYSQLRLAATNTGCARYRGEASGRSNLKGPGTDVDESWHATGLVYERYLDDQIAVPRFLFHATAGSVSWSLRGTEDGCAVSAGPVTLPLRTDGYNGQLDTRAVFRHGAVPTLERSYIMNGYGLPSVQGTVTCPHAAPYTRFFGPHAFLQTASGPADLRTIPGDGVLQGTASEGGTQGRSAAYSWRLVPDP